MSYRHFINDSLSLAQTSSPISASMLWCRTYYILSLIFGSKGKFKTPFGKFLLTYIRLLKVNPRENKFLCRILECLTSKIYVSPTTKTKLLNDLLILPDPLQIRSALPSFLRVLKGSSSLFIISLGGFLSLR